VDALYRRICGAGFQSDSLVSGEYELDLRSRELKYQGKKVELTQVEYLIMKTFLENPGKALSRDNILSLVWGKSYQGDLKVVDVNIRRLRLKIEEDAAQPKHITTVWGYGYKWEG
jgi:DNA-binding response OmpR family regulator